MVAVESLTRQRPRKLLSEHDWTFAAVAADSWSGRHDDRDSITILLQEDGLLIEFTGRKPWSLDEVVTSLVDVLNLPDNWDGYGARQPTLISAKEAVEILAEVLAPGLPIPSIVPTVKGGIQLEWHRRGVDLEVEVTPDGQVSGYLDDQRQHDEQEWDLTVDRTALSDALFRML